MITKHFRLVSLFVILTLILCLAACGGSAETVSNTSSTVSDTASADAGSSSLSSDASSGGTESDTSSLTESDTSSAASAGKTSSAGGGSTIQPTSGPATQYFSPYETYPTPSSVTVTAPAGAPQYSTGSQGGSYLNVGTQYVCEVVNWEAETFNGRTTDDANVPTSTPLPVGTVDYCSGVITTNGKATSHSEYRNYSTLRCGKRIYHESLNKQRSRIYTTAEYGALPETNNVRIASGHNDGRYTVVTLNVDWKAPFQVLLAPQSYASESLSSRNFTVSSVTYQYVDITFCYAAKDSTADIGNLNLSGTIFSRAEWRKNTADYTLRLYLSKTGGFYGWIAEYNSAGQLVFRFLNPARISGDRLDGVRVFLDVGHGGNDSGASAYYNGKQFNESDLNLYLARQLRTKLQALGATVIMSRDSNEGCSAIQSMQKVIDAKPDLAICIHHDDTDGSSATNGFGAYHYNAISSVATKKILAAVQNAGLYNNTTLRWHYYYCARVSACPVILTENGFMSNAGDLAKITNDVFNEQRAAAMAQGVLDYFKSIQ